MTTDSPESPLSSPPSGYYQNTGGLIRWMDTGYWYVCFNDGHNVSLDEYSEFLVFASEFKDYKVPMLLDRKYHYSADIEVYQYSEEFLPLYTTALAIVNYSSTSLAISEHLRDNYLRQIPVELFSDVDRAVQWLTDNYLGLPPVPIGSPPTPPLSSN